MADLQAAYDLCIIAYPLQAWHRVPCGGNLEWCPFSEEGKRVFMELDLPRPWVDTVKAYATCWTVDGVLLHRESRSERGGGRGNKTQTCVLYHLHKRNYVRTLLCCLQPSSYFYKWKKKWNNLCICQKIEINTHPLATPNNCLEWLNNKYQKCYRYFCHLNEHFKCFQI